MKVDNFVSEIFSTYPDWMLTGIYYLTASIAVLFALSLPLFLVTGEYNLFLKYLGSIIDHCAMMFMCASLKGRHSR